MGPSAVDPEEKAQAAYPKGDKVQVNAYMPGAEGYFFIQGMIHPAYGNTAG